MWLSTDPDSQRLQELLGFLLRIDDLKQVERQNPTADGKRRERTAEHSWHVAMACLVLARFASEKVDVERAAALAIVHDLPEVEVGDTFVYGPMERTRRSREVGALQKLIRPLPPQEANQVSERWHEYEYSRTPEGRYVMALDVLLPIFLNSSADRQSSWFQHGVTAAAVRERVDRVRPSVPALAQIADQTIDDAVRRGLLK
jgi:putative hydrolase of HD superfamily